MSGTSPDPEGLAVARRKAGWELGDPSWADVILAAYLNPADADEEMDMEDVPR